MQNKPNLPKAQMNLTSLITVDYENIANCKLCENKANSKPIKPNLLDAQMNINKVLTKDYENKPPLRPPAKQTQFKANFRKAKMNVTSILTKDYENVRLRRRGENKPNTNPIKPNLSRRSLWRSRFKANFTILPDPKGFKKLASADLLDTKECWGPLTLADGKLLIRDQKQMKCVAVR